MIPNRPRPWPSRRTLLGGLLAAIGLVVYGSLVPDEGQGIDPSGALRRAWMLWREPLAIQSRADFLANVLLGVPVGFLAIGVLAVDSARRRGWSWLIALVLASSTALGVEVAQALLPGRFPSASDVIGQILGAFGGIVAWLAAGQRLVDHARSVWDPSGSSTLATRLRLLPSVYAAGWIVAGLLPLELTIRPGDIARKYRDGFIVLRPFGRPATPNEARTILQWQMNACFLYGSTASSPMRPSGGGSFGGEVAWVSGTTANPVDTWTHVAMTHDGQTLRLYVNGNLISTTDVPGRLAANPDADPLRIGGSRPHGQYFHGHIDEVRVYLRALTDREIQLDMVTPVASSTHGEGLVLALGFDEGSGRTAADRSANGNAGRIVGASWTGDGKFGSALAFDGVNDLVVVDSTPTLDLRPEFTLEAWIFPTTRDDAMNAIWDMVASAASALPVGVLAFLLAARRARWRAIVAIVGAAACVGAVEFVQVFVVGRVADVTDILSGVLGASLGVELGASSLGSRLATRPAAAWGFAGAWPGWVAVGMWCAVLALYHWRPFEFVFDKGFLDARLGELSLVPFASYEAGDFVNAVEQVLVKTALALPLGVGLAFAMRPTGSTAGQSSFVGLVIGMVAVAVFSAIETVQLSLPDRVPDPSDVILGVGGALVGSTLTGRLLPGPRSEEHGEGPGALRDQQIR